MSSTQLFVHENMQSAEIIDFVGGKAAVFSRQSPAKEIGHNEDACSLIQLNSHSGLLVLADGVGGHRGAQNASSLAIETMMSISQLELVDTSNLREPILNAIEQTNETLLSEGLGAATTLLVVEIQENTIRPYYIGDSTILLCGQRGKLNFQSIAQSPTGYALEAGLMEEKEVRVDENRHFVSNIIGTNEMHITVGSWLKMAAKDTLLLCSDGLTDNVYIDNIIDTIRIGSLSKGANNLITRCLDKMHTDGGHPDDLSIIFFRLS